MAQIAQIIAAASLLYVMLTVGTGVCYGYRHYSHSGDGIKDNERAHAEQFKLQILKALGNQVQSRESARLPPLLRTLGRRRLSETEQAASSDTADQENILGDEGGSDLDATVIVQAERGSVLPGERESTATFTLKDNDKGFRATSAQLNLYIPADNILPPLGNSSLREGGRRDGLRRPDLKVEAIYWDKNRWTYKTERIDVTHIANKEGWHALDMDINPVRSVVDRSGRIELLIKCTNCLAWHPTQRQEGASANYLILMGKRRRLKQEGPQVNCEGQCCKRDLIIDFDELGKDFDWVLWPRSFHANYCWGSCHPAALTPEQKSNRTAQSILVDLMLQHRKEKAVASCCRPSTKTPLMFMYRDSDGNHRSDNRLLHTTTGCSCS